jgi:hypothetical protein
MLIGKTCFCTFTLTSGSTTNIGSGTYLFTVPFTSAAATSYLGMARFTGTSGVWPGQTVLGASSNVVNVTFPTTSTSTLGANMSNSKPEAIVPANGNKLIASLTYPTA